MEIEGYPPRFRRAGRIFMGVVAFVFLAVGCSSLNIREAAHFGNTAKVKEFLDSGVPVDVKGYRNQTPLNIALQRNHLDTARLLIERGADVNNIDHPYEETPPLNRAAKYGDVELARMMFDRGAIPYLRDKNGVTPLMEAAHKGHGEMVKLLLEMGVSPHAVDIHGRTAFLYGVGKNVGLPFPVYPMEVSRLENSKWFPAGKPGYCNEPVFLPGNRTISIRGDRLNWTQSVKIGKNWFQNTIYFYIRSASREKMVLENETRSLEIRLIDGDTMGVMIKRGETVEVRDGSAALSMEKHLTTSKIGEAEEWLRCRQ